MCARIRATRPEEDTEPVEMDGKAPRGAGTAEQAAADPLAFCTHRPRETRFQAPVGEKANEIPVAQAMAPWQTWRGRVCAADALHT